MAGIAVIVVVHWIKGLGSPLVKVRMQVVVLTMEPVLLVVILRR
jgi:hypothetical protein